MNYYELLCHHAFEILESCVQNKCTSKFVKRNKAEKTTVLLFTVILKTLETTFVFIQRAYSNCYHSDIFIDDCYILESPCWSACRVGLVLPTSSSFKKSK